MCIRDRLIARCLAVVLLHELEDRIEDEASHRRRVRSEVHSLRAFLVGKRWHGSPILTQWRLRVLVRGSRERHRLGTTALNPLSRHAVAAASSETFDAALSTLCAWLAELENSGRIASPPTADDAARLDALLREVWRTGSAPGQAGLTRASPEQERFRAQAGPFFWKSAVLRRCWEKPRGYAGDFMMMEALYRREPEGTTPQERWMDTWALELPGFQAVRNRRDKLSQLLREEHARGARRVMNVASGSAPELVAVARDIAFEGVTLMDLSLIHI